VKRGEIYLVSLDPVEGREQRGKRPVLIVSPTAFNQVTNAPVVLPITNGGAFAQRIRFAVPISGIGTTGVIRCDQPRTLDLAARGARKVDDLPPDILSEVMAKVATIFA
jgi:mRNA interferase ChpB